MDLQCQLSIYTNKKQKEGETGVERDRKTPTGTNRFLNEFLCKVSDIL